MSKKSKKVEKSWKKFKKWIFLFFSTESGQNRSKLAEFYKKNEFWEKKLPSAIGDIGEPAARLSDFRTGEVQKVEKSRKNGKSRIWSWNPMQDSGGHECPWSDLACAARARSDHGLTEVICMKYVFAWSLKRRRYAFHSVFPTYVQYKLYTT